MRVVQLTIKDIKRIEAVDITPDKNVQVIAGNNAQGKSSLIDALLLAILGKRALSDNPDIVRHGADKGEVVVKTEDFTIKRTFTTNGGTTVSIVNNDNMKYSSPQAFLDKLTSNIGFDPEAFASMKPKERREQLLKLIELPIDLDELAEKRKKLFDERTIVGRQAKEYSGAEAPDENIATEPLSSSDISSRLNEANAVNSRIESAKAKIVETRETIKSLAASLKEYEDFVNSNTLVDTLALEEQLGNIDRVNALIYENNRKRENMERKNAFDSQYKELTKEIEQLDETKEKALREAKLPIQGLSFSEDDVTFNNIPLSQTSSAEQISIGMAIAASSNPDLRVVRIKNGSLLDKNSQSAVFNMAKKFDLQLWVETVGYDNVDDNAIIIEEGKVKNQ